MPLPGRWRSERAIEMEKANMTYQELEQRLIENRRILIYCANIESRRRIIRENHELMTEMDRRWNAAR